MKKFAFIECIFCLVILFSGSVSGIAQSAMSSSSDIAARQGKEKPAVLTLDDCRMMALDSNRTIAGARMMEEKTRFDKNAMLTNFFPKISAYGYYLYTSEDFELDFSSHDVSLFNGAIPWLPDIHIPGFTLPFSMANSYSVGLTAVQPVFMGGKIVAGYRMTKIGNEMALLNTSLKKSEVIVSVDEAYWTYVKTCKLYDAAISFENTVNGVYKMVQDAVDVGMAKESDLLKVKVQQNNARLMVSKANNGKVLSRMALCHVLGLNLLTDIQVDTSDFSIDDDLAVDAMPVENRDDYQLLEKKADLARENVKVVLADYLPQLGVMVGYGYADALTFKGVRFEGGKNINVNDRLVNGDNFAFMARLNIPICSWGQGYFKVSSAKKEAEMAENEKQILQEKMQLEQTMYRFNTMDARLKVELCKSSLEAAESNLKYVRDYYEVGMETLTSLLEAQTQWNKANSDYIEAVGEYKLEYTRYLKASGQLGR